MSNSLAKSDEAWLGQEFQRCAPFLQAALDEDPIQTHTLSDVWREIFENRAQFWPTANSALVTRIEDYPTGARVLHHWLAGGKLEELIQTHLALESFARVTDCHAIEWVGRRGWHKVAREHGFRPVKTHFVKVLSDGQ